jgi:hypothetical protein
MADLEAVAVMFLAAFRARGPAYVEAWGVSSDGNRSDQPAFANRRSDARAEMEA